MIECKVCGHKFYPVIEKHYVARDDSASGLTAVISSHEAKLFDVFDCPTCGCQVVAQERKRQVLAKPEEDEDGED